MGKVKTMKLEVEFEICDIADMQYIARDLVNTILKRRGNLVRMEAKEKKEISILPQGKKAYEEDEESKVFLPSRFGYEPRRHGYQFMLAMRRMKNYFMARREGYENGEL